MKVLLTHSYFLKLDKKQHKAGTPYPPLATLYAASLLRNNNFDVKLADVQFFHSALEIKDSIEKFKPKVLVIYDDGFNYLNKMCLTNMREAALMMIKIAVQNNCRVIISGSDATDHFKTYLDAGAEFILAGEAEIGLLELLEVIRTGKENYGTIKGLLFVNEKDIVQTAPRTVLKELDSLPMPAWDMLDLEVYRDIWLNKHGYFSLNLVTTRGCPYKCNWCAKPIYGNRYNSHSPAYTVEMIKKLKTKTAPDHIWFADDIFGLKPGWLKEFAGLVLSNKLNFRYKIQSRADLLNNEESVIYLKESGCKTVWIGAESGSQKILDAMDKGIRVEDIYQTVRLLKKHKIEPALFIQFGYPGETMGDIKLTLKMIDDLMPDDIGISVSYPLPGTPFHEKVKQELKTKANWSDSDDLDLLFRNEYSSEFYKRLHRYVHKSFRARQSLKAFTKFISLQQQDSTGLKRLLGFPFYLAGAAKEKARLRKLEQGISKCF